MKSFRAVLPVALVSLFALVGCDEGKTPAKGAPSAAAATGAAPAASPSAKASAAPTEGGW